MKWSDEQLKAITGDNTNILVSAAAGSGKTAVVAERVVRLITKENPLDIERFLIVTFSKAAAAEMKERIHKKIELLLEDNPDDDNLNIQYQCLPYANISTLHAFCASVLKEYFNKVDLDPKFRITEDREESIMMDEIIEEMLDDFHEEGDPLFYHFLEFFDEGLEDIKAEKLIKTLYKFLMTIPNPFYWLEKNIKNYDFKTLDELEESEWVKTLKRGIKKMLSENINASKMLIEICNNEGLDHYVEALEDDIEFYENAQTLINGSFSQLVDYISAHKFKGLKPKRNCDVPYKEIVKQLRDKLKKETSSVKIIFNDLTIEQNRIHIEKISPVLKMIEKLLQSFYERFDKAKKIKNVVTYNDLEQLTLKVLYDDIENGILTEEAKRLQEDFDAVMVDEYQDSSQIQEYILNAVSKEKNKFMVGDVKQSIYSFRQAVPEYFLANFNVYNIEGNENGLRVDLSNNYRSSPRVLSFINCLFDFMMKDSISKINYDKKHYLNPGKSAEKFGITENTDIIIISRDDEENKWQDKAEEEEAEEGNKEDNKMAYIEAKVVAKEINRMMANGMMVYDNDTQKMRPLLYKDIAVILRTAKDVNTVFYETLTQYGIPCYTETGSSFFETTEIMTMMALLTVIDNPRQDIPLIALLRSPIFNFNETELLDIRNNSKKNSYYECLKEYDNDKCVEFFDKLNRWREYSKYYTVDLLILKLFDETYYYDYAGFMENGEIRQKNLIELYRRAQTFHGEKHKSVFNFVQYITKIIKLDEKISGAKESLADNNVVSVVTIHKSKGLEYPVVFLCMTGKRFNEKSINNDAVLLDREMGLGLSYFDTDSRIKYETIPRNVIKENKKNELRSEEMRLLYVALTRAKEKLCIIGTVKGFEKECQKNWCMPLYTNENYLDDKYIKTCNNLLDFIMPAVATHADGKLILKMGCHPGLNSSNKFNTNFTLKVLSLSEADNMDTIIVAEKMHENNKKEEITIDKEKVLKSLSYKYEGLYKSAYRLNYTVTELKKLNKTYEEEYALAIPNLNEKREIYASEIGTAYHKVVEMLDFKKVYKKEEIKKHIDDIHSKGFLPDKVVKYINVDRIFMFTQSDIYKRVQKSSELYKEYPFTIPIYTHKETIAFAEDFSILHGIVDLVFEEDGKYYIVDFKNDRVDTKAELIKRYHTQLNYYKLAIENILEKKVSACYIYSFHFNDEILVEV